MTALSPLREGRLTASRVAVLMHGSAAEVFQLWKFLVEGLPEEDLSHLWPVCLGNATEEINLNFYERQCGYKLQRRGEFVIHPDHDFLGCSLDAFDAGLPGPVDAKHVGQWVTEASVRQRYSAQMHMQMACTLTHDSRLSVIYGSDEPEPLAVPWDQQYGVELITRALAFWRCVEQLIPPVEMPPVAAPVPASEWRSFDFTGAPAQDWPNWAYPMMTEAAIWSETMSSARHNEQAKEEIKRLLPDDAKQVLFQGVQIKRAKNGAVTIRAKEEASNATD